MTKESENDFRKRMKLYPSHFDLDIRFGSTTVNRRNIIGKLCDQMKTSEFSLDSELTRTLNFLSYIYAHLHKYREANDYVNQALSKRPDDVMALSNQAWMHWRRDEKSEAWSIVEKLERLKERLDLMIIAKGEQAFAYSRFGPKYYKKAIDLYKDVITAAAQCEIEETYLHLWQFGLGLILKRQLHIGNVFNYDHVSECVQSMNDAFDAFYNVGTKAKTINIKARSWVALGELSFSVHNNDMFSPENKKSLPKEITGKQPNEFFDRAYEICDDDVYVLERCGKHARYCKDYDQSIKLLKKSVKIRETSFGHHHLAKTLTSVLNRDILKASDGSADRQHHKVEKFMRSPQHILTYSPNDQRVTVILHHLDKAIQCSPANCTALYDKGIVLRNLGRLEEAVELFIEIRNKTECSPLQAVFCLEQQALCRQRQAELETQPLKMKDQQDDVKHLLFKAIEIAADIAARVPRFQPRGTAFPSLREMLVIQRQNERFKKITTLREFATLYNLVGEYGKALPFWKEIFEMSEEAAKDSKIILPLAKSYVKQKDFRNGLLLLNLMESSCSRLTSEDRNIYLEAYLGGALHALEQGDDEAAKERFKRIIRFCSRRRNMSEDDGEDCTYDLHIQTSENAEENGRSLYNIFTRTCGLKVSLNYNQTAEALKYDGQYEGVSDIMERSSLIVLLLDSDNLKHGALRYFINMAVRVSIDDNIGNGIIVMCLGELRVPGEIEHFPVILQPPDLDISKLKKGKKHQWLKDFFSRAAEQPFPSKKPNEAEQTDSD